MTDVGALASAFEPAKGEVPLPLTGPSITLSPIPSPPTLFLFGGKVVSLRRLTSEMWALDLTTLTWSRVNAGHGPGPRYFHSMEVWQDKLVCFGGMSDSDLVHEVHSDIWFFDCRSRKWLPQPSPEGGLGLGLSSQDPLLLPQARYAHLSAVSRGNLIVWGGQRTDNTWIYEMNVYDLSRGVWVAKTRQPETHGLHSKGAYRSVAVSSSHRVIIPADPHTVTGMQALPYSMEEQGGGGEIWCYSNYDFAKVRRELEVIVPRDGDTDTLNPPSEKIVPPQDWTMEDLQTKMAGPAMPPGLRFPSAGIVGHHFVLCGLYLASTSAQFSIWTLDLITMKWTHIEPEILQTGSWNRAIVLPERGQVLVFGNHGSDLASDYGRRAVNLDHVAVVELEAYGIYRPPVIALSPRTQNTGLAMLDEKLVSDFEVISDDGRRIACSSKILIERWPWFAEQFESLKHKTQEAVLDATVNSLDINEALLGSLSPARLSPDGLHLPEPLPVCVALIQYFYTLSLATPLQTRSPILTALLFLSKQYKIERLQQLVVHALHSRLDASIALGVYEVATLAAERNLQIRALHLINQAKEGGGRTRLGSNGRRGGGSGAHPDGGDGGNGGPGPHGRHHSVHSTASGATGLHSNATAGHGGHRNSADTNGSRQFHDGKRQSHEGSSRLSVDTTYTRASQGVIGRKSFVSMRSVKSMKSAKSAQSDSPGSTSSTVAPITPPMPVTDGEMPTADDVPPAPLTRPRSDSFTVPDDVRKARPEPPLEITEDPRLHRLLDALDINSCPPARPPRILGPGSAPNSVQLGSTATLGPAPAPGSGRVRRANLPPMLPPPQQPLPVRPSQDAPHTPVTPLTDGTLRASSPTNSEATSSYPRTPSESHRDSQIISRESSPIMSSHLAPRPMSIVTTPSKTATLPALPEDELVTPELSSDSEASRLSTESAQYGDTTPTTAPIIVETSMGAQQHDALETLRSSNGASSKLTRAASLSSLNNGRPRSVIGTLTLHAEKASAPGSSDFGPVPEEDGDDWAQRSTAAGSSIEVSTYATGNVSKRSLAASRSNTHIPYTQLQPVRSAEEEQERLIKFQALLAEQQRQAGYSTAEADARARRAMGRTTPPKTKFGRLGAKFADALR
ncbi:hypothetical protein VHUM_03571 [Vanrija humicola]|uniref:BTB domain-containing protein n=1 Tax=Vanrija humicola TaxID=5417 RepID=A0A7D8UX72_VANHU|nr:hypothetical protein VHUM_03571 [Vanrija humicola]